MIKVSNLSKRFGDFRVLSELSMHVPKGAIYGLIGPNGAGKTTIINHINGVLKPESGEITVAGEKVYENEAVKRKILNIADEWYYFSTYTIKQMADFYRHMYPDFNKTRYEKLKELFRIDEKKQIRKLSKGQKKQVAFWLSLSAMPEVLILDEPLDGLDPVMRKQVMNLVIADVADRELTVLVSSHNLRELEDICDYVGIIHNGKLVCEKSLDDLRGGIFKYQVAFKTEPDLSDIIPGILNISKTGSVYNLIIKGDADKTEELLKSFSPILSERISLTLEEVFIYELGGMGYDFKNIIF